LKTVGDHIRKRRLDVGLLQKEAADRIGVGENSIANWESHRNEPRLPAWPGVLRFLGYDPRPPANTIGDRLRLHREGLGLSKEELADRLGLDPGTVRAWERWPDKRQSYRSIPVIARFISANPFNPPKTDGEHVKQYRLLEGLTQEQLASKLRVREAVVLEWERGRRQVPERVLETLACRAMASCLTCPH
jgi:transcriptional regulator with XRE-family HTH domain